MRQAPARPGSAARQAAMQNPRPTNLLAFSPSRHSLSAEPGSVRGNHRSDGRQHGRRADLQLRIRGLHVRRCCNSFSLALAWRNRSELWSLATSSGCPSCGWDTPMPSPRSSRVRGGWQAPPRPVRLVPAPGSREPLASRLEVRRDPLPAVARCRATALPDPRPSVRLSRCTGLPPMGSNKGDSAHERRSTTRTDRDRGVDAIAPAKHVHSGDSM